MIISFRFSSLTNDNKSNYESLNKNEKMKLSWLSYFYDGFAEMKKKTGKQL